MLRIVALLIGVGMIVVFVQALRRDGPAALAAWRSARINWSWVTVAVACALAGHAAYILGWRRLLSDIGGAREGVMQVILAKSGMASADVLLVVVVQRIGVTLLDIVPAVVVLAWRRVGYVPPRARP